MPRMLVQELPLRALYMYHEEWYHYYCQLVFMECGFTLPYQISFTF
jgi:hypothetical protein